MYLGETSNQFPNSKVSQLIRRHDWLFDIIVDNNPDVPIYRSVDVHQLSVYVVICNGSKNS